MTCAVSESVREICWRYGMARGPATNHNRVGVVVGFEEVDGVEGGRMWMNEMDEREGSWVPQHAFLSIPSILICRITPCVPGHQQSCQLSRIQPRPNW